MSKFRIDTEGTVKEAASLDTAAAELKKAAETLNEISEALRKYASTEKEGQACVTVSDQIAAIYNRSNRFRTAVINGATVYANAERRILGYSEQELRGSDKEFKVTHKDVRPAKPFDLKQKVTGGRTNEYGTLSWEWAYHGQYNPDTGKWDNKTDRNKDYKQKQGDTSYKKSGAIGISYNATRRIDDYVYGKKIGVGDNFVSAGFGHYTFQAAANATAGLYWDDAEHRWKKKIGADVSVGGSASVVGFESRGKYGSDTYNVGGTANADLGKIEGKAGTSFTLWNDGFKPEAYLEASGGLYACSADASGSFTLAGVKAELGGSLKVGVGGTAKIGIKDWKIDCQFGASLGLGFEVKFSLDFSNVGKGLSEAYDWAKDKAMKAVSSVGEKVSNTINAVKGAANSVVSFFKKWF